MGSSRDIRRPRPAVRSASDPVEARGEAIRLLARRDFTTYELQARLEKRGFDSDVVHAVISELQGERVLDDSRFVERYIASHGDRGEGPIKIAVQLGALGLPREMIETALAAGPDWRALAREVRSRKFGPETPSEWLEKARQARFLQSRGFSSDHIHSALGADLDLD
jgi:regulatory protein